MRNGDHGSEVAELQRLLAAAGVAIETSGYYDEATENAVRLYQQQTGLVADGIAGQKTFAALRRTGGKAPLSQADIEAAAARLGCAVAAIMAVNAVESRGCGFLDDGRPVILFERHKLYKRLLSAGADADALAARYPALINPSRGGYVGGVGEWSRLAAARQITADYPGLAEECCSWGQYQIMGYHWQILGYAGIAEFVSAMHQSEADQLQAFIRFIEADPALHKAIKAKKWADFARLYNGPAYKENLYDVKLAREFERYTAAVPA